MVSREFHHFERVERAAESIEYKTYAALAGAALAGAVLGATKADRERALEQFRALAAKQAEVVRKAVRR